MSEMRVRELLPFLSLAAIVAVLSATVVASADISVPDLFSHVSFGPQTAYSPGTTTTTVTRDAMPFSDVMLPAGFGTLSGDSGWFSVPFTSDRKCTQTMITPDRPETRVVDRDYDGPAGTQTATVTDL